MAILQYICLGTFIFFTMYWVALRLRLDLKKQQQTIGTQDSNIIQVDSHEVKEMEEMKEVKEDIGNHSKKQQQQQNVREQIDHIDNDSKVEDKCLIISEIVQQKMGDQNVGQKHQIMANSQRQQLGQYQQQSNVILQQQQPQQISYNHQKHQEQTDFNPNSLKLQIGDNLPQKNKNTIKSINGQNPKIQEQLPIKNENAITFREFAVQKQQEDISEIKPRESCIENRETLNSFQQVQQLLDADQPIRQQILLKYGSKIRQQNYEEVQKLRLRVRQLERLSDQFQKQLLNRDYQIQTLRKQIKIYESIERHPQLAQSLLHKKMNARQQQYTNKLSFIQQDLQNVRTQANQYRRMYDQIESQANQIPYLLEQIDQLKSQLQKNNERFVHIQTDRPLSFNPGQSDRYFQGKQKLEDQVQRLKDNNQNLKEQLQFCQKQLSQCYKTEQQLRDLLSSYENMQKFGSNNQITNLRSQIAKMTPILDQYNLMQKRYYEMKAKLQKTVKNNKLQHNNTSSVKNSRSSEGLMNEGSPSQGFSKNDNYVNASKYSLIQPSNKNKIGYSPPGIYSAVKNSHISNGDKSESNNSNKKTSTIVYYGFLSDCQFLTLDDRQFVYNSLHKLLRGVLKSQKLFNSKTHKGRNPHEVIDDIKGILLLIQLTNGKILGAYTHQAFSITNTHSSQDNIAFIFDIVNRRSFTNISGINSICYSSNKLIWGFEEIMINYEEPDIMYTKFCKNHNIYWDGKYKIQDFIGSDKGWSRIKEYQIHRVIKI